MVIKRSLVPGIGSESILIDAPDSWRTWEIFEPFAPITMPIGEEWLLVDENKVSYQPILLEWLLELLLQVHFVEGLDCIDPNIEDKVVLVHS